MDFNKVIRISIAPCSEVNSQMILRRIHGKQLRVKEDNFEEGNLIIALKNKVVEAIQRS